MHVCKTRMILIFLLAIGLAVESASGLHGEPPKSGHHVETRSVLIDTDMGLDDVRALFALLADTTLDINGIVTVEGSASAGRGADNLVGLLEWIRVDDIPVCRGFSDPGLKAPAWRETANSLGGNPFPPPRELSPPPCTPERMNELLSIRGGGLHYLALGPLGNLARLERERPGSLDLISTVWIPARIDAKTGITGWNLVYDSGSAEEVLRKAGSIILVDVSSGGEIDALDVLSNIGGSSPAVAWIEHAVESAADRSVHLFMHDELAAAALIKPELFQIHERTYRLRKLDDSGAVIHSSPGGNIRIATPIDTGKAVEYLKRLWGNPSRPGFTDRHARENRLESSVPAMRILKLFHGHLGPYAVLGYRMGKLALEVTGSEGHFGISAEVHSILTPPTSCLIDGVQLGSGCTLGKRNIEIHDFDGPAYAIFETEDGDKITIRLRPEIPGLISRLIEEKGVEAAGEDLMEMGSEALFDVED